PPRRRRRGDPAPHGRPQRVGAPLLDAHAPGGAAGSAAGDRRDLHGAPPRRGGLAADPDTGLDSRHATTLSPPARRRAARTRGGGISFVMLWRRHPLRRELLEAEAEEVE